LKISLDNQELKSQRNNAAESWNQRCLCTCKIQVKAKEKICNHIRFSHRHTQDSESNI